MRLWWLDLSLRWTFWCQVIQRRETTTTLVKMIDRESWGWSGTGRKKFWEFRQLTGTIGIVPSMEQILWYHFTCSHVCFRLTMMLCCRARNALTCPPRAMLGRISQADANDKSESATNSLSLEEVMLLCFIPNCYYEANNWRNPFIVRVCFVRMKNDCAAPPRPLFHVTTLYKSTPIKRCKLLFSIDRWCKKHLHCGTIIKSLNFSALIRNWT